MIGYTQEHLDPLRNPCAMVGKTGMYYLQPALPMQELKLARGPDVRYCVQVSQKCPKYGVRMMTHRRVSPSNNSILSTELLHLV